MINSASCILRPNSSSLASCKKSFSSPSTFKTLIETTITFRLKNVSGGGHNLKKHKDIEFISDTTSVNPHSRAIPTQIGTLNLRQSAIVIKIIRNRIAKYTNFVANNVIMWIERNNTDKILEAVRTRPVVLLTGVRQAGKSSLLKKLFPVADYVTLDKILMAAQAQENPERFLSGFTKQVIIDEIQYAPGLFRDLKVIVDQEREVKGKWILTGSQQFPLMQQVSESLAGRVKILRLESLSASELNKSNLLLNPIDLLWKGGFPEIWAEGLPAAEYFDDYIQTYLERDLKQILNVSNLRDFRRFLSLLAVRVGQLLNYSDLAKDAGVAPNTIKAWVNALEVSGLIYLLPPYYHNLGKRLIKAPKVYFCDNGLISNLLNIDSADALERSPHRGSIWENFVFTEMIKNGYVTGKDLFFYRDQNGVEIDFITVKSGKTNLIEAKCSERPDPKKLNFRKVASIFPNGVSSYCACTINEPGVIQLQEFGLYNPLSGTSAPI